MGVWEGGRREQTVSVWRISRVAQQLLFAVGVATAVAAAARKLRCMDSLRHALQGLGVGVGRGEREV